MFYGYGLIKLPTHIVMSMANDEELSDDTSGEEGYIGYSYLTDDVLDSRAPTDTHYHFGDMAGKAIFLPIEEHDSRGNLIISEMIGYDKKGKEVWV